MLRNRDAEIFLVDLFEGAQALRECEREFLMVCLCMYRKWKGDSTPIENFIVSDLIGRYQHANGRLTPDEALGFVEEFRESFQDHLEDVRETARRFPELVCPPLESAQPQVNAKAPAGSRDPDGAKGPQREVPVALYTKSSRKQRPEVQQ
jgi:hypothetical protein